MSVPGHHGRVRRAFARAARRYDEVSRVYEEIGRRLLTHLDPIAIEPALVLDVGCGTGTGTALLASRYRRARICAMDCAWPMLEVARSKAPKLFSRQRFACGLAEHLPLRDRCVTLVHANLLLPWCFTTWMLPCGSSARVLAPGGLLLLSSLGPDTLIEMRRVWAQEEEPSAVPGLLDMHDLGDALVRCRRPRRCAVMETERLTVQYPSAESPDRRPRSAAAPGRPDAVGAQPRHRPPESFASAPTPLSSTMRATAPHRRHAWRSSTPTPGLHPHAIPAEFRRRLRFPVRRDPSRSRPSEVVKCSLR